MPCLLYFIFSPSLAGIRELQDFQQVAEKQGGKSLYPCNVVEILLN